MVVTRQTQLDIAKMNPWLEEKVRAFHAAQSNDELSKDYYKLYGKTKYLGWKEYLMWRALKDAINQDPFLAVHRYNMDLDYNLKKWLYWNNVDRVVDLIQMTDEELRAITKEQTDYYDHITSYLSYHGYTLLHGSERTFKISSNSSLQAEYATKLDKWIIKAPGNINTFNLSRPTSYPEWVDEYYKRYEYAKEEKILSRKLVPVTVGLMRDEMPSDFTDYFISLKDLLEAHHAILDKYNIKPVFQTVKIPESFQDLKTFPLDDFITLEKDAISTFVSDLEQLSIMHSCSLEEYFNANNEDKVDVCEKETNKELQLLMVQHITMRMDYRSLILYFELCFKIKDKPWNEWPFNPWLQEIIMEYRTPFTDAELHDQYREFCENRRRKKWMDFITEQALVKKIRDYPVLLTTIDEMELDDAIKRTLKIYNINNLFQLIQFTDFEVNHMFYYDKFKREEIASSLEKQGFHLYHSDTFTYKTQILDMQTTKPW